MAHNKVSKRSAIISAVAAVGLAIAAGGINVVRAESSDAMSVSRAAVPKSGGSSLKIGVTVPPHSGHNPHGTEHAILSVDADRNKGVFNLTGHAKEINVDVAPAHGPPHPSKHDASGHVAAFSGPHDAENAGNFHQGQSGNQGHNFEFVPLNANAAAPSQGQHPAPWAAASPEHGSEKQHDAPPQHGQYPQHSHHPSGKNAGSSHGKNAANAPQTPEMMLGAPSNGADAPGNSGPSEEAEPEPEQNAQNERKNKGSSKAIVIINGQDKGIPFDNQFVDNNWLYKQNGAKVIIDDAQAINSRQDLEEGAVSVGSTPQTITGSSSSPATYAPASPASSEGTAEVSSAPSSSNQAHTSTALLLLGKKKRHFGYQSGYYNNGYYYPPSYYNSGYGGYNNSSYYNNNYPYNSGYNYPYNSGYNYPYNNSSYPYNNSGGTTYYYYSNATKQRPYSSGYYPPTPSEEESQEQKQPAPPAYAPEPQEFFAGSAEPDYTSNEQKKKTMI